MQNKKLEKIVSIGLSTMALVAPLVIGVGLIYENQKLVEYGMFTAAVSGITAVYFLEKKNYKSE